jgi:hypothetical protein
MRAVRAKLERFDAKPVPLWEEIPLERDGRHPRRVMRETRLDFDAMHSLALPVEYTNGSLSRQEVSCEQHQRSASVRFAESRQRPSAAARLS